MAKPVEWDGFSRFWGFTTMRSGKGRRYGAVHAGRLFFFSSRRRHTRLQGDWSSDVCSSDLATNRGHVRVAQLDKLHELADKPLHVGSWMIARLAAHTPSPPATASAKGAQLNGRPFPATASAEGAQFNVPPSLACMVPCCARVWPDCTGWRQSPSRGFRGARRLVS